MKTNLPANSISFEATHERAAQRAWKQVTKRNKTAKLSDLSPFLFQKVIDAPGAGAGGRKIEEKETKDHGDLADIIDREKTSGKMRAEISHRHFAGKNEC